MARPEKRKERHHDENRTSRHDKRLRGKGSSRLTVGGPGIFMSSLRGKEKKASAELIDFLEDIADRLYPNVEVHPRNDVTSSMPISQSGGADADDDLDALMNGPSSSNGTKGDALLKRPADLDVSGPAAVEPTEELDIEAQIRAELDELQPKKRTAKPTKGSTSVVRISAPVRRFVPVETGIECFNFISVAAPLDPILLVRELLSEVERTGETRGRFALRLTPVHGTCAANMEDIEEYARKTLSRYFPSGSGVAKMFKIEPRIRSHTVLKREPLIQLVANAIPKDGGHCVDLKLSGGPGGFYIVVEVFKNICAIAPLADYDRFRKYNPGEIAKAAQSPAATLASQEASVVSTAVDATPNAPAVRTKGRATDGQGTDAV